MAVSSPDISEKLWINLHFPCQITQSCFLLYTRFHYHERSKDSITCCSVTAENNMSGLLTAKTARENPKVVAAVEEVAKKLGSDGRILVRESGTEPLIRVMVEAGTDELCLENVDHVVKVMESEGLLID